MVLASCSWPWGAAGPPEAILHSRNNLCHLQGPFLLRPLARFSLLQRSILRGGWQTICHPVTCDMLDPFIHSFQEYVKPFLLDLLTFHHHYTIYAFPWGTSSSYHSYIMTLCYHNVLHFTAYTCIIIHISTWMDFFRCLRQLTPSHTPA